MKRGRKSGFITPDSVRQKIRVIKIAQRLDQHALGEIEMTPSQISAARILLDKTVASLQAVKLDGGTNVRYVATLPEVSRSTEEWLKRYAPTKH